jgi:hypothetical protein
VCAEGERLPGWDERHGALSAGLLDDLADVRADSFARGRSLDLSDAIAIALDEDDPQTVP